MAAELTRRQFLTWGAALGAGALVTACGGSQPKNETSSDTIYKGLVVGLQGKELLPGTRFETLAGNLRKSKNAFVAKQGANVVSLHYSRLMPKDFPEWINPSALPLPITVDTKNISFAAIEFTESKDPNDAFYVTDRAGNKGTYALPDKDNIIIGIHLGLPNITTRENGSRGDSALLLKEHLSLMLEIKAVGEWREYLKSKNEVQFQDASGNLIVDEQKEKRCSAAFGIVTMNNKNLDLAKIADALPMFIIGSQLDSLVANGEFPNPATGLDLFIEAYNMLQKKDNEKRIISDYMNKWTATGVMLPPDGLLITMEDPGVHTMLRDYYDQFISPIAK